MDMLLEIIDTVFDGIDFEEIESTLEIKLSQELTQALVEEEESFYEFPL